jgi:acyl carrier protein
METKIHVRAFLQQLLQAKGDEQPLADDDSLLLSGRLQSIDAVDVVVFLEESFGIDFADIGFDQEQLDSIDAICTLIETIAGGA